MANERPIFSPESEHGVIGALLHKPELAEQLGSFLLPEHFYNADNAALFSMILAEHARGNRPDVITLSEYRAELPTGESTLVYAAEIQRNVPGTANAIRYAKIVKERYQARQLQNLAYDIVDMSNTSGSIAEQVASAQAMLMTLAAEDERPDVVTMGSLLAGAIDKLDEYAARDPNAPVQYEGVRFGLPAVDNIVKSLRPGNLVIIAGRPGTGKTVLGVGLADQVAIVERKAALVFSLEMEGAELVRRSLSANSGVLQDKLDGTAQTEDNDWPKLTSAVNKINDADYRLCDKGALPFSRIASIARYQHRVKKLDLIVVDYIGLVATEPGSRLFNRSAELGFVSRGLKALAKELKVPVVVLAQLNRGIEGRTVKRPQMSDLRDSGDIEQDADVIIFAHRDESTEDGQDGITEIYVEKCRHAKTGHCQLQFRGEIAKFVPSFARYGDTEAKQPRAGKSMLADFQPKGARP